MEEAATKRQGNGPAGPDMTEGKEMDTWAEAGNKHGICMERVKPDSGLLNDYVYGRMVGA